ncbi:MAG TPA: TIGR01459 family HAD-type hydrolase [Hyphomicrobiaceae bacterium]|nr:TIGR01459 family HAD-type hydrolase [Hyphomicrobiaceae bacterium]
MQAPPEIPIIPSVAPLASRFDAWICDIWGVLHNGVATYPKALDACRRFRASGGTVILVSNAPRPNSSVLRQFETLGIAPDAYDLILTSGDVTRAMIEKMPGTPTLHIGPERDLALFDGLDLPRVTDDEATFVLCSGLYDDTTETPDHYTEHLTRLVKRRVPMLCANPDIKVDRGGTIVYCAGAIAARYAELGGLVTYAGKPHAPIYDRAFDEIGKIRGTRPEKDRVLAIGDGVHTDIEGGVAYGIPSLYVPSAIHLDSPLDTAALARLFPEAAMRPTFASPALAW